MVSTEYILCKRSLDPPLAILYYKIGNFRMEEVSYQHYIGSAERAFSFLSCCIAPMLCNQMGPFRVFTLDRCAMDLRVENLQGITVSAM